MDRILTCSGSSIRTKSDLMKYALENTFRRDSHGGFAGFDYDEALKLYHFYLQHVVLPDTEPSAVESIISQMGMQAGSLVGHA